MCTHGSADVTTHGSADVTHGSADVTTGSEMTEMPNPAEIHPKTRLKSEVLPFQGGYTIRGSGVTSAGVMSADVSRQRMS